MTIAEMKAVKDVPVVIVDREGKFIFVNTKFEEIFGWRTEEILGESLAIIIPLNLRDAHHMGFSRFLMSEKPTLMHQPLNLKAINRHGHEFDAIHFIIGEKINGEWQIGSTIQPI